MLGTGTSFSTTVNQQNYEQQQRIAKADIQQAQVALNVAQEQYDRDRELLSTGAIPRRTVLESGRW